MSCKRLSHKKKTQIIVLWSLQVIQNCFLLEFQFYFCYQCIVNKWIASLTPVCLQCLCICSWMVILGDVTMIVVRVQTYNKALGFSLSKQWNLMCLYSCLHEFCKKVGKGSLHTHKEIKSFKKCHGKKWKLRRYYHYFSLWDSLALPG